MSEKSVLLPSTEYSSHYNDAATLDANVIKEWETYDIISKIKDHRSKYINSFILHDGPPYANGHIHLGHAVNKILKDFVSRSHRMMRSYTLFRPGWDCHGLPIERKVEKEIAEKVVSMDDISTYDFRQACRNYAKRWVENQMDEMKRLAVTADWSNPYLTMDNYNEIATLDVFHWLVQNDYVYTADRPVHWSVPEQTALADAEVIYKDSNYQSLFVKFPLTDEDMSLVCWTTTPWSIPGNRAVACNPEVTYGVYLATHKATVDGIENIPQKFIIANDCSDSKELIKSYYDLVHLYDINGDDLVGKTCDHPLKKYDNVNYQNPVPVVGAEYVRTDSGTGLVHIAPSLGPEDFALAKKEGIEIDVTLDADGRYNASVPVFAGSTVLNENGGWGSAQREVIQALHECDSIVYLTFGTHSVAHSWRSEAPLLYRATPQLFVDVTSDDEKTLKEAISELDTVSFYPESAKQRMVSMLVNRPDWCVSRQRAWGVPVSLFVNKKTKKILKDENVWIKILELYSQEGGTDNWYRTKKEDILTDYNPDEWDMVMDVLDVWFDSGSTFSYVEELSPADLYLEGSDQHRGWFQSSLLLSTILHGGAPFKMLFTHGFVLDKGNNKMAKSKGNGITPKSLCDEYGVDTLRLWVASSDVHNDISFDKNKMPQYQKTMKKLRNTLKWLLGNANLLGQEPVSYNDLEEPERWMLSELYNMNMVIRNHASSFNFLKMNQELYLFCLNKLSAVWFNMRKDALYCDAIDSLRRRGIVTVVRHVFECLCKWLAPLFPVMAEQAWSYYDGSDESVHLQFWEVDTKWNNDELLAKWQNVIKFREEALAKTEGLGSLLNYHLDVKSNSVDLKQVDLGLLVGTSSFSLTTGDDDIKFNPVSGEKCPRCRIYHNKLEESGMCLRCDEV